MLFVYNFYVLYIHAVGNPSLTGPIDCSKFKLDNIDECEVFNPSDDGCATIGKFLYHHTLHEV